MAWQPMDTAIKDGTEIVLMNSSMNRVLAHWMPGGYCIEDHPEIAAGWYFWNGRRYDIFDNPVRWRSAQPVEEKKQEPLSEQRVSELLVESGIMNHRYPSQPMFNDLIRLAEAEHGITSNAEGGV